MSGWQFWIDRGGTFTDVVARSPDGRLTTTKVLSENPERYADAATAGVRTILGLPLDAPLPDGVIDQVKMGTTVATNALLERTGARTLLVVDQGFADLLVIGHQTRPRLFDLNIQMAPPLFEAVEEVGGRIDVDGQVLSPLDEAATAAMFARRRAEGLEAVAIVLAHAWKFPQAEQRLAALARTAGFTQVSVSHEVSPLVGLVSRGRTTVVDAYLSPVLRRYVDKVTGELGDTPLFFMQSNGGLARAADFQGKDAVLSGPAGGVVGAARTAEAAGEARIIAFDMGGTSTDVSLYAGAFERVFDTEVAGAEMRVPMMAIETVAAGGGSVLRFDGARFRVGPESAGANPGPAAYRRGGPLTVTDANVMCGKVRPELFPTIFGPGGDQALDRETVKAKFDRLAAEIGDGRSGEQTAEGFLRIVVANMAAAIKRITLERGENVADFTLQCFGGAGGQHACLVADELGMTRVLIHPFAGVLSAYGMGLADQTHTVQRAIERPLEAAASLERDIGELAQAARARLAQDEPGEVTTKLTAHLRYEGTDTALGVPFGGSQAMRADFEAAHQRRFGFCTPDRAILIESLVAEAVRSAEPTSATPPSAVGEAIPLGEARVWMDGQARQALVLDRANLGVGAEVVGPALIREDISTTVVEPGWRARVLAGGELLLSRSQPLARPQIAADRADPVLLELFNSLFMGVAEQMGAVLRNTSTSVNIKERLDFSCAVFDAEGALIANAPHVPVHLGAMGESVRAVLASRRGRLRPGDAIVLNNPYNGGTHLPDVTVVTPVFAPDRETIRFFVANRGHHADIGGVTPGSMPPSSRSLAEEGVVIDDFLIVEQGRFREEDFRALLGAGPWPARSPDVNVADIKAQLAANEAGARELDGLVDRYGWDGVRAYMGHVMANAEESIRRAIDRLDDGVFDYRMDDGAPLKVSVRIDREARSATIDFTGVGHEHDGNFNAPPSVTRAAVLYAFRCLVGDDLPLNEGCLAPLNIVLPEGSFLSPAPGKAVVAGNTEVSQAVCAALLGALGVVASAQGTMNNFLFGSDAFQYYETICGGAGAGPDFHGASAVHTHMTNTRITDPEVLELRYPVRLDRFAIRRGSGGQGRFQGGDGVVRAVRALTPMTATLVGSRRRQAPFGLDGGDDGRCGDQWVLRADGAREALAGVVEVALQAGDLIVIETPGGGGFGPSVARRSEPDSPVLVRDAGATSPVGRRGGNP